LLIYKLIDEKCQYISVSQITTPVNPNLAN